MNAPYASLFGPRGLYWFSRQEFVPVGNQVREHAIERLRWTMTQCESVDKELEKARAQFPQVEALTDLKGIGLFTALLVVGEFGDVTRFRRAKQAAAYRGLTTRTFQSAEHTRTGHISK